jgi:hypothetical protein
VTGHASHPRRRVLRLADGRDDLRVDLADHQHHLPRGLLLRLVIGGVVERRRTTATPRAAPATFSPPAGPGRGLDVTVRALHAERGGERLHRLQDLRLRRVLRKHLEILGARGGCPSAPTGPGPSLTRDRVLGLHDPGREQQCRHEDGHNGSGERTVTADHAHLGVGFYFVGEVQDY